MEGYFETYMENSFDGGDYSHVEGKEMKSKKTMYHTSNSPGQFIKNAVTGVAYPWRVGSLEAQQLFKVVDTLGNCDDTGLKLKQTSNSYPNPSPNHCYYDSPQQFMSHRRMTVQQALIQQWEARQELFKAQEDLRA